MYSPDPRGLTFEVVTEELVDAATAVEAVTEVAREGLVEQFPAAVAMGHARLTGAVTEFSARWDTGLGHLIGDSVEIALRLRGCATAYLADDEGTRSTYQRLNHGWQPEPVAAPWWVSVSSGPSLLPER